MQGFERIAPFLTNPLVLIGFAVMLFFGLARSLLRAEIIPPLPKTAGGRLATALLAYGFILAFVIIVLGFALEAYRVSQNASANSQVVDRVRQAVSQFGTIEVSYEMRIPLSDPALASYLSRLRRAAEDIVDDFRTRELEFNSSNAARGTPLTRRLNVGVHTGYPDESNLLLPSSLYIHGRSPLLPERDSERLAHSLLSGTSIHFTFYVDPIEPTEYRNIFAAMNPDPDIAFGASTGALEDMRHVTFRYDVGADFIVLEADDISVTRADFMAYSGRLTALAQIPGAQVFIHSNAMNEALGPELEGVRRRIKDSIELTTLEIYFGTAAAIEVPIPSTVPIDNDWGDDVRVYRYPHA